MAAIGRNPPYIIGLLLFVIFQIPIILAPHISVILVFRFLSGFVGSPALATGGGSMADIFEGRHLPAAVGVWALGGKGMAVAKPRDPLVIRLRAAVLIRAAARDVRTDNSDQEG
ncbi:hypothetical protein OIO90_000641 [Microbotryomycetes sp. JL221]|nr:hypothetical protein OIO90_000641 [Microbotryomycetes sp. JL221]